MVWLRGGFGRDAGASSAGFRDQIERLKHEVRNGEAHTEERLAARTHTACSSNSAVVRGEAVSQSHQDGRARTWLDLASASM